MWLHQTCGSIGKIVVLGLALTDVHFNLVQEWNTLAHESNRLCLCVAFNCGLKPNSASTINAGDHNPESPFVRLVSKMEVVLQVDCCPSAVVHGMNGGVIALPY